MDPQSRSPSLSHKILFWASFFTLIAAGMGFSIRGEILGAWGSEFGFTQTELGEIQGWGLAGFGVTIIIGSIFTDLIGYGLVMVFAFLFHALSVGLTLAAPFAYQKYGKEGAYWCLLCGQACFSLANGTCEAVINPLTATLFPNNKTHWLNILHAGWPGGLVLGALVSLGLNQVEGGVGWQIKWAILGAPVLLYGVLMVGRRFPQSEARESGVPFTTMIVTIFSPILLFLFLIHMMIGYVELGTDGWIINITNTVLADSNMALIAFIWTNVLMFTLRFFAGPIVHKISPLGLLFCSAVIGALGLYLLGQPFTDSKWPWLAAVTVYGIGKTFYWPTMLGVISERFPKGGALALGLSGGLGMISAGLFGSPGIGYKQDYFAVEKITQLSPATYERYVARNEAGDPEPKGFPIVTKIAPDKVPPVAGLDNSKIKVMEDHGAVTAGKMPKTTLDSDLEAIAKARESGGKVEPTLEKTLTGLKKWWEELGKPNYETDKPKVEESKLFGGKQALLYTAAVPATMAVCYLLLVLFFKLTGGYKQKHINH
jgi:Major Facilitator Superfamily